MSTEGTPVTVTVDPGQTKIYGASDPLPFTYSITSGNLISPDSFSGSLSRVAGENVGTFAIGQGTLALSSNYDLTFVGANFSITARPVRPIFLKSRSTRRASRGK